MQISFTLLFEQTFQVELQGLLHMIADLCNMVIKETDKSLNMKEMGMSEDMGVAEYTEEVDVVVDLAVEVGKVTENR